MAESIGHGITGLALEASNRASCQAALSAIERACGRRDILVNSAGVSVGGVSKAAVTALTKSIALHCAQSGYPIRANAIHPGGIETAMFEDAPVQTGLPREEANELWRKARPMGRIGKPAEVAQAALWLASEASSFTTDAEIAVDGGAAIRP